jgi:hypothetical protein
MGLTVGQKRFPKDLLTKGGILHLVDERVSAMMGELSPGVIIAVLSSFRRIGMTRDLIPNTAQDIVAQVSSLACTLDIRTFLLTMRALSDLGYSWSTLSNDQRLGIAAGIARCATANPSKLGSILTTLVTFGVTWQDMHDKIPVVLRYVVFKIFSAMRPANGLTTEERQSTLLYIESLLRIFADMKASWAFIGDKGGITILQALSVLKLSRDEESSLMPLISNVLADIPPHTYDAVPPEFRFLFHVVAKDGHELPTPK